MAGVNSTLAVVRRTLQVPALVPVAFVVCVTSWASIWLARESMGATAVYLDQVRHGCLLFSAVLVLTVAEPLRTRADAAAGIMRLRFARSGALGLLSLWLGLTLACLPLAALVSLVTLGWPQAPLALLAEVLVLVAGGLALGALLDGGRLVPALWGLLILGHLQPWLASSPSGAAAAWALPRLGGLEGVGGWVHAALWSAGALCLARAQLLRVVARGN